MHVSIPLLVFAVGALSSPMELEKRSVVYETFYTTVEYTADTVYVTETPATETPATETPVVLVASLTPDVYQLPTELTKYHRHRHTPKHGSPRPATQIQAAPTPKQLQVSIHTLTSTSTPEIVQSEAESKPTPDPVSSESATSVANIPSQTVAIDSQLQPPTTFVPNLDPTSQVYKALVIQHHNIHRRNHSASDLTWSDQMAQYAETTANSCKWGHSM